VTADAKAAAYQRLDAAIQEVSRSEECEGVPLEWVVVAYQRFEDDGASISPIGRLVPDGGNRVPFHRILGLLDYAHTHARAEVSAELMGDDDD
jgi:hypothetical protein